MSMLGYILSHPVEAGRTFWRAFRGTDSLADRIKDEEIRLGVLRTAIFLYHESFGRYPQKLEDLCHNNHNDPEWDGEFISWDGKGTFQDTFGFPYRYIVIVDKYELISPGLETAKSCVGENG
jgi:hypothetical protein